MNTNHPADTRPIAAIKIGPGFRKDIGDLQELADGIKLLGGLLHPIVIDHDNNLLAGERRLRAAKIAGLNEVPVSVLDANSKLVQWAENYFRKELTVSERLAIANEVAPLILQRADTNPNNPAVKEAVQAQLEAAVAEAGIADLAKVNTLKPQPGERTKDVIAKVAGFGSRRELEQAETIVATGDPALIAKVDSGVVSLQDGEKQAKKMQAKATAQPSSGTVAPSVSRKRKGKVKAAPGSMNVYYDKPAKYKIALPKKLKDIFGDTALSDMSSALTEMIFRVKSMVNWNPHVKVTQTMTALEEALQNIDHALPYAVCRAEGCQGNGCDECHGKGWWTKGKFEGWLQQQQFNAQMEGYDFEPGVANGDVVMDEHADGDWTELDCEEGTSQVHETDHLEE